MNDTDQIDKEAERLSKDDIDLKDVKNEKELPQKPLVDLLAKGIRKLTSGFSLPADLTLKYAMGDMTPVTKSPGAAYDKATLNVIRGAHIRKGDGTVDQSDYSLSGGYDNIASSMATAAVQGAKNNFRYNVTPNGIEVRDRFNFKDPSNPANVNIGFFKNIPGAQNLATNLVKIGDKRAELAGHDPRDDNYGVPLRYTIPKSSLSKGDRDLYYGKDSVKKNKVTESVSMKKKLKTAKEFFKQADIKPTFPENPPPELDPKTGMHPNYGKQASRYTKLDPLSAKAMPKTADPEIDAEVEKAKKKPK